MNLETVKILSRCTCEMQTSSPDRYKCNNIADRQPNYVYVWHEAGQIVFTWEDESSSNALHNFFGPAKISKDLNTGKILREEYYLHGNWVPYSIWLLERTGKNYQYFAY